MRGLVREERAAILELHPDRTEDELDRFESLLHDTLAVFGRGRGDVSMQELDELEARLFPRFEEALELAAQRRDRDAGDFPVA